MRALDACERRGRRGLGESLLAISRAASACWRRAVYIARSRAGLGHGMMSTWLVGWCMWITWIKNVGPCVCCTAGDARASRAVGAAMRAAPAASSFLRAVAGHWDKLTDKESKRRCKIEYSTTLSTTLVRFIDILGGTDARRCRWVRKQRKGNPKM